MRAETQRLPCRVCGLARVLTAGDEAGQTSVGRGLRGGTSRSKAQRSGLVCWGKEELTERRGGAGLGRGVRLQQLFADLSSWLDKPRGALGLNVLHPKSRSCLL